MQTGDADPKAHLRYSRALHEVQHHDEQLNARVVAAYAGMVENYDGIEYHLRQIANALDVLSALPDWIDVEGQQRLQGRIAALREAHQRKQRDVDRSSVTLGTAQLHAVLSASSRGGTGGNNLARSPAVCGFSRQLLAGRLNRRLDQAGLVRLENELRYLQDVTSAPRILPTALAHAEVLIRRGAKACLAGG